ncbi:GH12171 [Drosophila grimshawi]|uniref:GH12171 n=1 Tax=Drosophila grimshawi TaxID=7222 RepID=B4JJV9_DROGR|nr:GH12171 [Drosophila grimshawi]
MFKQAFKRYKIKTESPDLQDVIDLDQYEAINFDSGCHNPAIVPEIQISPSLRVPVGLQSPNDWRCYTLANHPGLLVIRNPFTPTGQRYWIARSLRDYPQAPNYVNLDAKHFSVNAVSNWWGELHQSGHKTVDQRLKTAMRWTTLGYHHNWDTKVYDEAKHTTFPSDLSSLCQYFSLVLGYQHFIPQAAIVNYYPIGTTLSGHTDHSELNLAAPLFSLSFGQTAIFLIGGMTLEEQPTALYLRSGDVLVMSEKSRLCYHAVPRVMKTHKKSWNGNSKEMHEDPFNTSMDSELYDQVKDEDFWMPFEGYINDSRININVRQVLPSDVSQIHI